MSPDNDLTVEEKEEEEEEEEEGEGEEDEDEEEEEEGMARRETLAAFWRRTPPHEAPCHTRVPEEEQEDEEEEEDEDEGEDEDEDEPDELPEDVFGAAMERDWAVVKYWLECGGSPDAVPPGGAYLPEAESTPRRMEDLVLRRCGHSCDEAVCPGCLGIPLPPGAHPHPHPNRNPSPSQVRVRVRCSP